jgi:hypothetical protein
MLWSVPSILIGALLAWLGRNPTQRAIGQQAVGWGVIDAAIALGGQASAERKQMTATPVVEIKQAQSLRRILWLNTGLDVLYVLGGLRMARTDNPSRRGHGTGIAIQGGFLFVFDLVHALRVPRLGAPDGDDAPAPSLQEMA